MESLQTIQNFILYITACDAIQDENYYKPMKFSPSQLYNLAEDFAYSEYVDKELTRVSTNFVGTEEDKNDFIREWETLLGTKLMCWSVTNMGTKEHHWSISAYIKPNQIDEFDMDSDWITERN